MLANQGKKKTLGVSCHELRGCGCGKPCRCLQPERGLSQPARQVQSWWSVAVEIIRNTNLPSCECRGAWVRTVACPFSAMKIPSRNPGKRSWSPNLRHCSRRNSVLDLMFLKCQIAAQLCLLSGKSRVPVRDKYHLQQRRRPGTWIIQGDIARLRDGALNYG